MKDSSKDYCDNNCHFDNCNNMIIIPLKCGNNGDHTMMFFNNGSNKFVICSL